MNTVNSSINIGLAFIEGFSLIISPCILPILPIILAGSLEGNRKRPLGIIVGFVIAFAFFTFFSKKIVEISGLDLNLVRNAAFVLLILFGIIMISTTLTELFGKLTQKLANVGSSIPLVNDPEAGFFSGFLFGGLIGLIWTPCAGPILAAVIVQIILQNQSLNSFLILLAFSIGAAVPMLLMVLFGRKATSQFNFFKKHAHAFRKILGLIILISVFLMINIQSFANPTPIANTSNTTSHKTLINPLIVPYPAPEIASIEAWINSKPLILKDIKAKAILIDFWAYSCINCIRTLPYLTDWYQKYHQQGLEIIGVHSPEFDFERNLDNVKQAVAKYHIQYPIALDNQFQTWQNYHNQYWPAHYLIDGNGKIVYQHFGEGDYDITENNIQALLGTDKTNTKVSQKSEPLFSQTPETYLGYARANEFSSKEFLVADQPIPYSYPAVLNENAWALQGKWIIAAEKIIANEPLATIKIHFRAAKVFAVMGSRSKNPITVKISLDNKPMPSMIVSNYKLYTLIDGNNTINGLLELQTDNPDLEIYTFTFGT